jgi:uncharacterized protein (TIGR03435 family)
MMRVVTILLCASLLLGAQTFDAVSIRPNPSDSYSGSIVGGGGTSGRLTITNTALRDCVAFAFGIPPGREFQLVGPGWLDTEKFDIAATYPAPKSREQIQEMLKKMLAERFGLKVHYEPRELESYALVVAKKGAKLKPNTDDAADGGFIHGPGHITMRAGTMAGFANRLSGPDFHLDRPVVDLTEIKGAWDFSLAWSPDGTQEGPSLFTALEEQLGLRLETRKLTFQILVVDSVSRTPTAN